MSKVCCVNADSYEQAIVQKAVDRIFDLLELDKLIHPEYKVLIKPNLLLKRKPSEATTTHPNVVLAIINKLEKLGVTSIVVADSPGGLYTKQILSDIYNVSGMQAAVNQTNATLNTNIEYKEMKLDNAKVCKSFNIIKPVHEADFIISVGKVKTHGMTTMSGGVKNLFGCIPGLQKPEMHCRYNKIEEFCEMLIDLALCVKPNVTFMDGIVCMEGDGPSGGTPKECKFITASESPFELDVFLSNKIGLEPKEVPTIIAANKRGLCSLDINELSLVGDDIAYNKREEFIRPKSKSVDFAEFVPKILKKPATFILDRLLVAKPYIQTNKCVGCGKCAESCPQKTIKIINKKAVINYSNCIKCFCCHEMCPIKAIDMKRALKL